MSTNDRLERPRRLAASPDRILSADQCVALRDRIESMCTGGGSIAVNIDSQWTANLRWARNHITTGGDTQTSTVAMNRNIFGAHAGIEFNGLDDASIRDAVTMVEQNVLDDDQSPDAYPTPYQPYPPRAVHPISSPLIWFDRTYELDAEARVHVVAPILEAVSARKLSSAGYIQVDAQAASVLYNTMGVKRYYPRTRAQFSITVRDVANSGSGWAGIDHNDWAKIDTMALTQIAIDKCERSRNPVAVEPGRHTAILEPQAVTDLIAKMFAQDLFGREWNEDYRRGPFFKPDGSVKIGERLVDDRISIVADPMDPECAFLPFDWYGEPYLKTDWIRDGVLKNLSYSRDTGIYSLHLDQALPDSHAFRIDWRGPETSMEEMIATTDRGILVTRFSNVQAVNDFTAQISCNTRDGTWLIEKGKISKAVKNFRVFDSPLFFLNNVIQVGPPRRTFRPEAPAVSRALKVRDFNFAGLADAV